MKVTFQGRPVEIMEFDFTSEARDAGIADAYWADNEAPLTDAELYELSNEQAEVVYDAWIDEMIIRAERAIDLAQDR